MYKNISKKILSFLFVFTLFFISLNNVKAATFTLKQNTDRLSDYTSSYTTRFWATNNGTSETEGANAFCIDPDNHTPAVLNNATTNGNIKTVSGVTSVPYNTPSANHNIKLLLYYGIGGPGWERASQHWYNIVNSNDCSASNLSSHFEACANGTYAKEHILLSLVDGACSTELNKCSSYGCRDCKMSDASCSSCPVRSEAIQLLNALQTLATQENLFDSSDNIPGFNVYIYNEEFSSGGQRIIYWTYTPQKGYIEVTKNFTNKIGFSKTDNEVCRNNISFTVDGHGMTYNGNCQWVYGLDNNKPTLDSNTSHEVVETTTNYGFNVFNGTTNITSTKKIIVNIGAGGDPNTAFAGKKEVTFKNELKRCLMIPKIDSISGNGINGVTVKLYKNNKNGNPIASTTTKNKPSTGSPGFAIFNNLNLTDFNSSDKLIVTVDSSSETNISNNTYSYDGNDVEILVSDISASNVEGTECLEQSSKKLKDTPHKIDWYKTDKDGNVLSGAKFNVKDSDDHTIKYKIDQNGQPVIESGCYVYDPNGSSDGFESDANGYTCISYVNKDKTYTVTETLPADFHTYNSTNSIPLIPTPMTKDNNNKLVKSAQEVTNTFVNIPTEFEFTKGVSDENENTDEIIKKISSIQLKKLRFNIYTKIDNIEYKVYVIKNSHGFYEYAQLVRIDNGAIKMNRINSADATSSIQLDDDKNFKIKYLPKGDYYIKEEGATINNNGTCDCEDNDCIPFYFPDGNVGTFSITYCSSDTAASYTKCQGYVDQTTVGTVTSSYKNILTELKFTKKDFYSYGDANDVNGSAVSFEDTKERSDFDRIVFNVKDSQGNVLRFIKVGNNITDSNNKCLSNDDYSVYRYVPNEVYDTLTAEEKARVVTDLHTCGGHIHILGLCRGKTYKVEEVSVPEDSVYVKEVDTNGNNPSVEYTIKCCADDTPIESDTVVINDKPTRVRFEKRDSKYNYLIPDETTTFRVYQCPKNEVCHPADGITSNMKLMKFHNRAVIIDDEENPIDEEDPSDAEGLEGVEVYRTVSDSDLNNGTTGVSDLHPYKGILVLRYLPAGYNYVLLETVAPKNYTLPIGRNAETMFTVTNTTVSVEEVSVPNIPTSLIVRKYSDNGNLLTGAKFKIYKKDSCDSNIKASKQISNELKDNYVVNLKTIRDGVYEVRPIEDTNTFTTCTGSDCNSISTNPETKLTYSTYLNTKGDFSNLVTESNTNLSLQEGEALIQYLEYGKCYIIEEVKAPNGYSLPENEDDRFVMINIDENNSYGFDTKDALINSPTPFTFYKYDEYNNLIDGAEFKLQKLNKDKVYEDITVTKEEKDDKFFYKVDKNTDNVIIETKNGQATVYYLEEGQYRIVEIKSPDGKELPKNPNIATFFVDSNGKVYGNSIISNKSKTEKIKVVPSAQAEFIVGIRTGQKIVKYGLIIAVLSIAISVLMFINNKNDKFDIKRGKNGKK